MRAPQIPSLVLVGLIAVVAGCSTPTGEEAGGGDEAPSIGEPAPELVEVPAGARVLDRSQNRGSNPSAAEFDPVTLKPPLPPLYIRISTEPPAGISVNGTLLCQDYNTAASVQSDLPFAEGEGELVVRVPLPRGVREGMECTPIFAGSAETSPGKVTRVTSELLAAPG